MNNFIRSVLNHAHLTHLGIKKEEMSQAPVFKRADDPDYFKYITGKVNLEGLWIEMGVCTGTTITKIATLAPENKIVHGFDSFEGLPEDWNNGQDNYKKGETFGTIRGAIPCVPDNVLLHKGLFEETLPSFVKQYTTPVAFLHVDCDLYSSTKTMFDCLGDQILPGTIIAFDEIYNFPNYAAGEFKAFKEFLNKYDRSFELVSYIFNGQQLTVKII